MEPGAQWRPVLAIASHKCDPDMHCIVVPGDALPILLSVRNTGVILTCFVVNSVQGSFRVTSLCGSLADSVLE